MIIVQAECSFRAREGRRIDLLDDGLGYIV